MNDAYFQQVIYKKPCLPEDGKRLKSKVIYIYVLNAFASLKVLITGGTGFIGSNIANTLSSNNDNEVIALDDLSLGISSNLCKEVKIVKGSVMDYQLILELCRGCDYVFHHTAKSSTPMFKN